MDDASDVRAAAPGPRLERLLATRSVIVCVGSGGVGKTTVAASLGLAAAAAGRRTLCLTIDPARRLAQSLGLAGFSSDEVEVSKEFLASHGLELPGSLTVMMLDAGKTFDELVDKYAESAELRSRVKNNRLYQHVSRRLAGTHAYMAMEKVQALLAQGRFDVIVLDTPPSERALDFFDAPERMRQLIGSPVTRTLARISQSSGGKLGLKLVNSGVRGLLKGMGRVAGVELLEELGQLLSLLDGLFGGFAARADEVGGRLKGSEFGYVLVTAPTPLLLDGAAQLAGALERRGITVHAWVANRLTPHPGPLPEGVDVLLEGELAALGLGEGDVRAALDAARFDAEQATRERRALDGAEMGRRWGDAIEVLDLADSLQHAGQLWHFGQRLLGRVGG